MLSHNLYITSANILIHADCVQTLQTDFGFHKSTGLSNAAKCSINDRRLL